MFHFLLRLGKLDLTKLTNDQHFKDFISKHQLDSSLGESYGQYIPLHSSISNGNVTAMEARLEKMEIDFENALAADTDNNDNNDNTSSLITQYFAELSKVVDGSTPLHLALKSQNTQSNTEIITKLLSLMLDYEIEIDDESIKLASDHGNLSIKQMVLETVHVPRAVKLNNYDALKARLNKLEVEGEDMSELYEPVSYYLGVLLLGPLCIAVQKQNLDIVELLVKHLPLDKNDAGSVEMARTLPDGTLKCKILALIDDSPPAYSNDSDQ